ncbi:MAG: ribonuclease H-like domain-containing protein [Tissierellia bacterium]|nr:ribonuclease H-like domain-containing protein [Tissierellia bacterium]
MEKLEYLVELKKTYSNFEKKNICFLDIETTGLSRKYDYIYLIGLLYFNKEKKSWAIKQFFAENIYKEKEILEAFADFIDGFHLIVTYNGDSFDLPFIKCRLSKYGIDDAAIDINTFDIYREIKKNSSYINLENLRLKTIEEYLGIHRDDKYSGKDCIKFYNQYMNTKDALLRERILKHNYDDLFYLWDILKIFDIIEDSKTLYIDLWEKIRIEITNICIDKNIFSISCDIFTNKNDINVVYFHEAFNLHWQGDKLIINLEVKEGLITPTKKCVFFEKTSYPPCSGLKDLSQYMVPDDIILLKVEDKYIMENIKNLIKSILTNTR